jgi:membrane protein required for colicin V production
MLNPVDWIVLLALVLNLILGAIRGFFWQVLRIATLILGIILAGRFAEPVGNLLQKVFTGLTTPYHRYSAYALIFFTVYLVLLLITHLMRKVIKKLQLGGYDRFLGALFGVLKGVILAYAILFFILLFCHQQGPQGTRPPETLSARVARLIVTSHSWPTMDRVARSIHGYLPQWLQEKLLQLRADAEAMRQRLPASAGPPPK